jgi:hypothetical protein
VDNRIVPIKYLLRVIVGVAIAVSLLFWIFENVDQRGIEMFWTFWFFVALVFSTAVGFTAAVLLERLVVRWTKLRRRHSHRPVLH